MTSESEMTAALTDAMRRIAILTKRNEDFVEKIGDLYFQRDRAYAALIEIAGGPSPKARMRGLC